MQKEKLRNIERLAQFIESSLPVEMRSFFREEIEKVEIDIYAEGFQDGQDELKDDFGLGFKLFTVR